MPGREDRTEKLLAKILGAISERFKNKLVLKGGILLRLLNSPRSTQDLDYCWVRTEKRALLARELSAVLEELPDVRIRDVQANSRGVFLTIQQAEVIAKIEVTIVSGFHRPPKPISTAPLTGKFGLRARVIAAMDPSEALAHKIAACLERDLARDMFDLTQLEPITELDRATLEDRISRLEIGRAKPRKLTLAAAAELLESRAVRMTFKRVSDELQGVIPDAHLPGLDLLIRATVSRIAERIRRTS